MKTISEWIELLPAHIRERMLFYYDTNHRCVEGYRAEWLDTYPNLHSAINYALHWSLTDEGNAYWHDIYLAAQAGRYDNTHWIYYIDLEAA